MHIMYGLKEISIHHRALCIKGSYFLPLSSKLLLCFGEHIREKETYPGGRGAILDSSKGDALKVFLHI